MKTLNKIFVSFLIFVIVGCGGDSDGMPPPAANTPEAAVLVFPLSDAECNTGTVISDQESIVTFEWNAAEFADAYTVKYTNLNTNTILSVNATGTTKAITIKRNTPYSWSVISRSNSTSVTKESDTWRFFNSGAGIENYAPFPAKLVGPSMGSSVPLTVELEWKGVDIDADITDYKIYLATTNPPTTLIETTTNSKITASGLTASSIYYWKVVTTDSQNNTSDSPVFQFRTVN